MFWSTLWDDKINFTKLNKEDFFIKALLPSILWDSFVNRHFFMDMNIQKQSNLFQTQLLEYYNEDQPFQINEIFYQIKKHERRLPYYFVRLTILRYQGWVFIFTAFFKPSRTPFDFLYMNFDSDTESESEKNFSSFYYLNFVYHFMSLNFYKIPKIYDKKLNFKRNTF